MGNAFIIHVQAVNDAVNDAPAPLDLERSRQHSNAFGEPLEPAENFQPPQQQQQQQQPPPQQQDAPIDRSADDIARLLVSKARNGQTP